MSKKKKKQYNKAVNSNKTLPCVNLIEIVSYLIKLTFQFALNLKVLLVNVIMLVATQLGVCGDKEEKISSKKEARLRNKQRKLMAEYALVTDKEGGDDERGGKRRKLDDEGGAKKSLDQDQFKAMKQELRERKRNLMQIPRLRITQMPGLNASVFETEYVTRTPLLLSDIQHLVTYAYGGNEVVPPPSRWCSLQKPNKFVQIVVLVVEGLGLNEFVDNEEDFSRSMKIFGGDFEYNRGIFEILDPRWYGTSGFMEVRDWGLFGYVNDPLLNGGTEETDAGQGLEKNKSTENEEEKQKCFDNDQFNRNFVTILKQLRSVFPINDEEAGKDIPEGDKFPRTSLILTLPQLIQENYPLPIPANSLTRNVSTGYTLSCESYAPPNANSKMFSIDCEMCETVGDPNALIRVGIVDEECNVVYESLVKPRQKIIDYRTKWSGVKPSMMEGVDTRLEDVQKELGRIVRENPGCIFVGQSLNCDLKSLRILHPYVIDTSTIFNLSGIAGKKSSLKDLSFNILDEVIQNTSDAKGAGHCPVEDARAAMKLVKAKLSNGFSFGNVLKSDTSESTTALLSVEEQIVKKQLSSCGNKLSKNVLIITQQHEDQVDPFPFCDEKSDSPDQKSCLNEQITIQKTSTNGTTTELMYNSFLEYFLTVGFYRINENESENFHKTLGKVDKRIEKIFNRISNNSLFVVVGAGGSSKEEKDDGKSTRRNNGICLIRVKANENGGRVRKD